MSNLHDHHFKELMAERVFFESFMKAYLPRALQVRMDWSSLKIYRMGAQHVEKKTQKEFEADVVYLAKLQGKDSFIWVHVEHQSAPDKLMALRIVNYQTAELLAYAKQNPLQALPSIVTFIYHQGKKPWPYSLEIKDLFAQPKVAMQYFAKPILIDLPLISDEELKKHQSIGAVEVLLKHVRKKDFKQKIKILFALLRTVDDSSRAIVLKYAINFIDVSKAELSAAIEECLPNDKDIMMNMAERWTQEGREQGMQQGIQQGAERKLRDIARNMLKKGCADLFIQEITKLSLQEIADLKKETDH